MEAFLNRAIKNHNPLLHSNQSSMSICFFNSIYDRFRSRLPVLLYAVIWTLVLTVAVAVAAIAPEAAFMWSISPSSLPSSLASGACDPARFVRVPVDFPTQLFCLPIQKFRRSAIDLLVPPIFAAIIVAGSACVVRAFGL